MSSVRNFPNVSCQNISVQEISFPDGSVQNSASTGSSLLTSANNWTNTNLFNDTTTCKANLVGVGASISGFVNISGGNFNADTSTNTFTVNTETCIFDVNTMEIAGTTQINDNLTVEGVTQINNNLIVSGTITSSGIIAPQTGNPMNINDLTGGSVASPVILPYQTGTTIPYSYYRLLSVTAEVDNVFQLRPPVPAIDGFSVFINNIQNGSDTYAAIENSVTGLGFYELGQGDATVGSITIPAGDAIQLLYSTTNGYWYQVGASSPI